MKAENIEEGFKKYSESKQIFKEAKMNLREFISNSKELMKLIPKEDILIKENPKVLGIPWNSETDILSINILPKNNSKENTLTRRIVLMEMAATFDPLGLIAPINLKAKIFFQKLWTEERNWDTPLSNHEIDEWNEIKTSMEGKSIEIPRLINVGNNLQLHAFVDASQHAYATVIYLRNEFINGNHCNLIFSKNRLKPKKGLTIPRLELMAILIGVRALQFAKKELRLNINSEYLWSDSQCSLHWLKNSDDQSRFVKNRLHEIRQYTNISYNFVPTNDNPADILTRGNNVEELNNNLQWWHGPKWLKEKENLWPNIMNVQIKTDVNEKFKNPITLAVKEQIPIKIHEFINIKNFNSYKKLIRVAHICFKFISKRIISKCNRNLQRKFHLIQLLVNDEDLLESNYAIVEKLLIKIQQYNSNYSEDLLQRYQIYKDNFGIMRIHTRMGNSELTEYGKYPIFLNYKDRLTLLLIDSIHIKLKHNGPDATLFEFLQTFWTQFARKTVKYVLNKCFICRKFRTGPYQLPLMPNLPEDRVKRLKSFESVGIDYLGHTYTKIDGNNKKIWIIIITCLTTRAVFLDLILDLSAITFINSFRRFISRRGKPTKILSDNGRCFVLGAKVFDNLWKEIEQSTEFKDYLNEQRIIWKFIPELSPWQGGIYERLVALVKSAFKKSVGKQILPFDEMNTFISEVESILNNRPLTYVSDDSNGILPLRPIDFINPNSTIVLRNTSNNKNNDENSYIYDSNNREKIMNIWKGTLRNLDEFWEKWKKEYLILLREKNNREHKKPHITSKLFPKLNEIVLLEDEFHPRNIWKMAKIVELPNNDPTKVKNVKILMPNKRIISRPINKLYPLEITENNIEEIEANKQIDNNVLEEERNNELEREENSNKNIPEINKNYNLRKRKQIPYFTMLNILTFISLIANVYSSEAISKCSECQALCTTQGISLFTSDYVKKVEICCENLDCITYNEENHIKISLSNAILVNKYYCKFNLYTKSYQIENSIHLHCPAHDECEILDCTFCLKAIYNPECNPTLSTILLTLLVILLIMGLCVIITIIRISFKNTKFLMKCFYFFTPCCNKNIKYKKANKENTFKKHNRPFRFGISRKIRRGMMMAIMITIILFKTVNSCTEIVSFIAHEEKCFRNETDLSCEVGESNALTILPNGQTICLLIKNDFNSIIGYVKILMDSISIKCQPRTLQFVRSYEVSVKTNERCPKAGSCRGDICSTLTRNQTLEEFNEFNSYFGNVYCEDGARGFVNFCPIPSPSCVFYRTVAKPIEDQVYEIFTCDSWYYEINLKMELDKANFNEKINISLIPGSTFNWNDLTITVTTITRPPTPIINQNFITDTKNVAIIDAAYSDLECNNFEQAKNFNCNLNPKSCINCRRTDEMMKCHCQDNNYKNLIEITEKRLPIESKQF